MRPVAARKITPVCVESLTGTERKIIACPWRCAKSQRHGTQP
jgi:hypothetical protein